MYAALALLQAVGIGVAAIVVVIAAIFVVSVVLSAIKVVWVVESLSLGYKDV